MNPVIVTLLVILGVGLLLVFSLVGIYNQLVLARNRFTNAFAQIDVQLKRRYDLIPNLIEAVKGYMAHERETLDAVIKARKSAMAAEQNVAANPADPAVESRCGAVAVGPVCLLPPLSSGGARVTSP